MKYFVSAVSAVVIITAIAGLIVAGSPGSERERRFDEQRVNNLQIIQSEIIQYWQSKGKLPVTLGVLIDDLRGVQIPKDPETQTPYEYEVKGDRKFTLCATFRQSLEEGMEKGKAISRPEPAYMIGDGDWSHGAGRICFDRTIDPDFYKQKPSYDPVR